MIKLTNGSVERQLCSDNDMFALSILRRWVEQFYPDIGENFFDIGYTEEMLRDIKIDISLINLAEVISITLDDIRR